MLWRCSIIILFLLGAAYVWLPSQSQSTAIAVNLFTDSDCEQQDNTTRQLGIVLSRHLDDVTCFIIEAGYNPGAIKVACSKGAGAELLFYEGADNCYGAPSTSFYRHTLWNEALQFFEGGCVDAGMGMFAKLSRPLSALANGMDSYPLCPVSGETIHTRTHRTFVDSACKVPLSSNLTTNTGNIARFWWLAPGTYCYHTLGMSIQVKCDAGYWVALWKFPWIGGSWASACAGHETPERLLIHVLNDDARKYFDGECVKAPPEFGGMYGRLDDQMPCGTFPTCGGVPDRCQGSGGGTGTATISGTHRPMSSLRGIVACSVFICAAISLLPGSSSL
eukprot:gnl/TRDRNA2_/TRDRNA2_136020_c1_seq1.p1 gnl/TRDRNA2_/TRDRNA2_136020_c1~~gnl/TRDRNA2_/TRDRNA2_136020_c1_seq1.p1  ORF type:complete len:334 (-),score=23.47 gnl/TRDRNA2_/TRDRNA2_136020_c1_seq1:116-1117(-)